MVESSGTEALQADPAGDERPKEAPKRWVKIIKKTGKILFRTLLTVVVLMFALYILLRIPAVQTWVSQRAAAYLSKELKTKVTIGGVDIQFFKTIVLEDIYIEDRHQDTLLLAHKLKVDIDVFSLSQRYLKISSIALVDANLKVKKYRERGLNYRFILKYFQGTDTTHTKSKHPWKVELGDVSLTNVRFAYIDTRDTIDDPGMDYENIRISSLNAAIGNIEQLGGDSVRFKLKYLSAHEKSGFTLEGFSANVLSGEKHIQFENLDLRTHESRIGGFLNFRFDSIEDISDDFVHRVKLDGHLTNTTLEMADLIPFSTTLTGIHQKFKLAGDVSGTISRLRCKNVDIRFGQRSHIIGDFNFTGLPKISETDLDFKIKDLLTTKEDIESLPVTPFTSGEKIQVPPNIATLGDIHFKGGIDGFLDEFVTYGSFNTALGRAGFNNVAMWVGENDSLLHYEGDVTTENFNVGRFFDIDGMSLVSSNTHVTGRGVATSHLKADLSGQVQSLTYRDYPYHNIAVDGHMERNVFKGKFKVTDDNIDLDFKGDIDFSGKLPVMDFTAEIERAQLAKLHLLDTKDSVSLAAHGVNIHLTGNNIDNLDGTALVNTINYTRNDQLFTLGETWLQVGESGGIRKIYLDNDFINVNIQGQYQLLQLTQSLKELVSVYLPAYFPPGQQQQKNAKKPVEQNITFTVELKRNTAFANLLVPELHLSPYANFSGEFHSGTHTLIAHFSSDQPITYKNVRYEQPRFDVQSGPATCDVKLSMADMKISDSLHFSQIRFHGIAGSDTLGYALSWDNLAANHRNDGSFAGKLKFNSPKSIGMNLRQGNIHIEDSLWTVQGGNDLRLDSTRLSIQHLSFVSGTQAITADGVVSKDSSDQVTVTLERFNLENLNPFIVNTGLTLRGMINGKTNISNIYDSPIFSSNTDFTKLNVNSQTLGDGSLTASWNPVEKAVVLGGTFGNGFVDNLKFYGSYYPRDTVNSLDLSLEMQTMDLRMFAPYVKDYCSIFTGTYRGKMTIKGTPRKPILEGQLLVFSKEIRIDYLNIDVGFVEQPITIEDGAFHIENFHVYDKPVLESGMPGKPNDAVIYGNVFHDHLTNFQLDIDVELKNFQVLNTTAKQNSDYYGNVFASGYVNIFGFLNNISISVNAKSDSYRENAFSTRLSKFYIPMSNPEEVSENDFITFVKKQSGTDTIKVQERVRTSGITVNLDVQATPDMEVLVIFDEKVGDVISARGSGDLSIKVKPDGDLTINGDYTVEGGAYLFTLKNLINKPFSIARGSRISWSGDPYNAEVDLKAVYKVTAPVKVFFPDEQSDIYSRSYPVELGMNLTGNLMKPAIEFDIQLPTADRSIQDAVTRYTMTELERNRQAFSLLVLNQFMTPSEFRSPGSDAGSNNVASTTTNELLISQLNVWLEQISRDVDVKVKYRQNDQINQDELELYLGKALLNDRLTIDGSFGVVNQSKTTTQSASNIVGDVNVEYKITKDGKVRVRAFNKSNDNTLLTEAAPFTQGIGVFYREDFETFGDLYRRYRDWLLNDKKRREEKKKEEEKKKLEQQPPDPNKPDTDNTGAPPKT